VVGLGGRRATRRGRAPGIDRIPRLAGFARQVPQDPVDDSGLGDEGDDFHLRSAATQKRVHLEDFAQEARPRRTPRSSELRFVVAYPRWFAGFTDFHWA